MGSFLLVSGSYLLCCFAGLFLLVSGSYLLCCFAGLFPLVSVSYLLWALGWLSPVSFVWEFVAVLAHSSQSACCSPALASLVAHWTSSSLPRPGAHWLKIRTNNVIERLNREIRRRTRVVGTFPDGNSALMLVCARLRHVSGTSWGTKRYMSMTHFEVADSIESDSIAG